MSRLLISLVLCAALPRPLLAGDTPAPAPLKTVRANGVTLSYLEQGTGVPVILVHGGLEDYRSWQPQMDALSQRECRNATLAFLAKH